VLNDTRFLVQATLLGLACSLIYVLTGSLMSTVWIHCDNTGTNLNK